MTKLNNTAVFVATRNFYICFTLLVLCTYFPFYLFFKSCKFQNEYITKDLNTYKSILNKHLVLKQKIDSLYDQLSLLNTGKVNNDLFLEKYIADNKIDINKTIGADSITEFRQYNLLMGNIENILKQKDTILGITNKEQMASTDLIGCINKTRKVKKDLSFDPSRNFSSTK